MTESQDTAPRPANGRQAPARPRRGPGRKFTAMAAVTVVGASLWCQVVFDLFVLTMVVHYVGSMETYTCSAQRNRATVPR